MMTATAKADHSRRPNAIRHCPGTCSSDVAPKIKIAACPSPPPSSSSFAGMISTARQKPKGPIDDPSHHLTGPFTPSAPPSPAPPPPATAPRRPTDGHAGPHSPKPSLARGAPAAADVSPWLRWAVDPSSPCAHWRCRL
ncbi:hypothetical protein DFH06DRAFT_1340110 [Mycena polygramma]|nr:hypothetical protein DFH06DRAFT_1340110 [Mycena polygramma]